MKKSLLLLILFGLIQVNCFSQLNVTSNANATALAQAILGSGVTVSNATLNCGANGAGTFTYAGATLGVSNGIILTTGLATDATLTPAQIISQSTGNNFTDPDLATIVPVGASGSMNDVCYIAFDFVPLCNQISVTYEFGSSEYQGFQCSTYNDAFGLFITGPNPVGGNYTSNNAAVLPNGTPVSINNINNGQSPCTSANNPSYYIDNTSGTSVVYEGLTTAITSVKAVVPCSTYTIKIAIADMGDEAYDSGVFIQGNSLNCTNTPTVTPTTTAANCGTLGSATVTVTNYTGTPTYQWLPGGATTPSISNLTPGTYTCLVGLQSGCGINTQTITATVGSVGASFNYTTTPQNPSCNNGTNGTASVLVNGGAAPYTYTWTSTPAQNTNTATNLAAGTYSVNITDNTGCIGTTTVTLVNPPAIVATVTTSPTTCSGTIGVATASVTSGGTAPYNYVWNNAAQTQTINNLAQGTYSVIISDVNSCTTTATGVVGGQGFTWSLSALSTNPTCFGSADGSATVTVNNPGASTFTYSWTTSPAQTTNITTPNLSAGTYTAFVTDNNGCTSNTSVTLVNPPPITAKVNTSPTMCSGATGSATVSVLSGGTSPYQYAWISTNPVQTNSVAINLAQGNYSVVVIDVNNCSIVTSGSVQSTGFTWTPVATSSPTKCFGSNDGTATVTINNPGISTFTYISWNSTPAQTNTVATNLAVGNYTVTIKDNNGCVSTASVTVTQPNQLIASTQSNPAMCTSSSGWTNVIVSGGTSPYTYQWSNTNPSQTTQMATNLAQGPYIVLVTDANSCTVTATATVGDTTDLTVKASQSPDLCSKGVGKATANPKGQAPYTYIWTTNPVQTNQTADSLKVGTYSVTVTDAFGCIDSTSIMVLNQNDVLSSEFTTTPAGVINAEDPIALNITTNAGWKVDSAYLSNGVPINKNPFPYTFAQYGDYTATYYFTSSNGCKDTVTYNIIVKDYITLYIPNAFSPNGDGRNDNFEAQGTFIKTFEMYIYDRWGVLVKKITDINTTWDGTKSGGIAPEDIYVYKGSASDIFGKFVSFHGQISLIR